MSEKKTGIFRTETKTSVRPTDIEGLFRDLKGRSDKVPHLWSHQADILRVYHGQHLKTQDVAFELPTGAGKTLVGLLVGEYRRRKFDERVVYLCPTRQLAKQVGLHAALYGIPAHVLVGPQREYSTKNFHDYQAGSAIAITTYSGVFNTSPKINDPHLLILDDAHASENYISSTWSVEVSRDDYENLYLAILSLFASSLPPQFAEGLRLGRTLARGRQVDLVPGMHFRAKAKQLIELFDEHLTPNDPAHFSLSLVRDHLWTCNLFISPESALLRPLVPPTLTHAPFAQAKQRVYMSATLGAGGELERISGVPSITRLPVPAGWNKQGSGRRLFLMPGVSLDDDLCKQVCTELCKQAGRSLVLVPDNATRSTVAEMFQKEGLKTLGAKDIENSLTTFTDEAEVVLILANRFDGLDLPGEACRMLVVAGLPVGTNLQETFLYARLQAFSLLRDRVLTRLTQAFGRCTRAATDFATVLLIDQVLIQHILKAENRQLIHPELQAEIAFGIDNSGERSVKDFIELFQVFSKQGDEWQKAEERILDLRENSAVVADASASRLMSAVKGEVSYCYNLWRNDLKKALEDAVAVSDALSGGNETKGYRAWWYYLVGDVALMLHETTGDTKMLSLARENFGRAARCSLSISWFAELAQLQIEGQPVADMDQQTPLAVENAYQNLAGLGLIGPKFEGAMVVFKSNISSDDYRAFQDGLRMLGACLGFCATVPGGSAVPDCVWSLGDKLYISHEAKTEQSAEGVIGVKDVLQAKGHSDWVKANRSIVENTQVLSLIESPRSILGDGARPHAGELYYVAPSTIRKLAEQVESVLRSVRAESTETRDHEVADKLRSTMNDAGLLPHQIVDLLTKARVSDMPTS